MKIKIIIPSENKNIKVSLPNALVINHLTSYMIAHASVRMSAQQKKLSYSQANSIMKALKKCRKKMGKFELVSIESADGEVIKIEL